MRIFLSGTFKDKRDEERLQRIRSALIAAGNTVWWAGVDIQRGYSSKDEGVIKPIVEIEKKEIAESDLLVAVLQKPTPGTMMEILHAWNSKVPVIACILENGDAFDSAWFKYHVSEVVFSRGNLLGSVVRWADKRR